MPTDLSVTTNPLYHVALVPLLGLIALRAGGRRVPPEYWVVALGFSVSWFADFFAAAYGNTWALTYVYPALQLGLFAWAFGAPWVMMGLVLLAAIQVSGGTLAGPEVVVTLIGSVAVLYLSTGHKLAPAMLAYCGAATGLYLLLIAEMWRPAYMPLWYGYQASRLTAFALFGRAAWKA